MATASSEALVPSPHGGIADGSSSNRDANDSSTHPTSLASNRGNHAEPQQRILVPDSHTTGPHIEQSSDPGIGPSNQNAQEPKIDPWAKKYVLTLDGGGIRGYSTLLIIKELMEICGALEVENDVAAQSSYHPVPHKIPQSSYLLEKDRGRSTRYLPFHYFDYIAGTSTGGLIAIMLSRLRMDINDCIGEYEKMGNRVFGKPRAFSLRGPIPWNRPKFDHKEFEAVIQEVVDSRLQASPDRAAGQMFPSHESRCRTIVIARKDQTTHGYPYLFRTYAHDAAAAASQDQFVYNAGAADAVSIVDVSRATTAAPTYFKHKIINNQKYIDGGFGTRANNPSLFAYREVKSMHGANRKAVAVLVSIGTGILSNPTPFPETNTMFGVYKATISYAIHLVSEAEVTHREMLQIIDPDDTIYDRFNVDQGLDHVKLGDWKTTSQRGPSSPVNVTLETIRAETTRYCNKPEVRRRLQRIAGLLVENRQKRSKTEQWDFSVTGSRYKCTIKNCDEAPNIYTTEGELCLHLSQKHGYTHPAVTEEEKLRLQNIVTIGKVDPSD